MEAAPDTPSVGIVLIEALIELDPDVAPDVSSDDEEIPPIPPKNELVVPEARVVEGGSKEREDSDDGREDEADSEGTEEELGPNWLTVELDAS